MILRLILIAGCLIVAQDSLVLAQTLPGSQPPAPRRHSFEIGVGVDWLSGFDLGSATAELPRNPTTGSDPFILFTSEGRQESSPAVYATIGYHLTETFMLEASGSLSKPDVRISISDDAEITAGAVVTTEGLTEYTVGGGLVVHLQRLAFGRGRGLPFVRAGAEIIRQVVSGAVEDGAIYHLGGGLRYVLVSRGNRRLSEFGVRGEGRVNVREGAFVLSDSVRVYASVGGGIFLSF